MKKLPSYATQYGKILDAYMKDEIKPFDANFCFCGTLASLSNDMIVAGGCLWETTEYTGIELLRMESKLLTTIAVATNSQDRGIRIGFCWLNGSIVDKHEHPNYENALFNGMSAALDVLKQIHESHGEIIDAAPVLPIRTLQLV